MVTSMRTSPPRKTFPISGQSTTASTLGPWESAFSGNAKRAFSIT